MCPATNTRVPNNKDCHTLLVKVVGGAEGKEEHGCVGEPPLVVHPLLGVGVLIGEAFEVPSSQP